MSSQATTNDDDRRQLEDIQQQLVTAWITGDHSIVVRRKQQWQAVASHASLAAA